MDPKEFPAILTSPECKNRDWLYFEESKRNFGSLMGAQPNYELLDRAANEIGFSRDRFKTGEYLFEAVYMPLDLGLQAVTQHHPEFGSLFVEQWLRAKGNEGYAQLAQALLQYHQAWHARSNGAASTVTPEGWKLFYAKLDEANSSLESASSKLKQTGPWHDLKVRVTFANPKYERDRTKVFEAATNAWPDYVALYGIAMNYMHPRWGGSYEAMEGVAQMALKKTRQQHGAAVYAQVYERQFRADCDCTLADSKVDWPTMKQGFHDLEARPGIHIEGLKHHARMACQMRDRDEARRLYVRYDEVQRAFYEKLGRAIEPEQPDDCRLFASR
jgi:hypothetical protein